VTPRALTALAAAATVALTACAPGAGDEPSVAQQPAAGTATPGERTTLVIGSVSDDPGEEAEVFQPFVDRIAADLAAEGVTGGEVVVAASVEEMSGLLAAGEVDLYVDNMYGVTTVVRDGAGEALLRRWKDGEPTYHSVVVARRDSGITTVDQLAGRTVAFEEETSTDGYFLPVATLRQQGLALTELARQDSAVPAGEVGYVFSGDDENTVFLVLDGRVSAGALSEEDLAENAGSRLDELVTVTRTVDVPRHGVVVRRDLDPALLQALTGLLSGLHETTEGRDLLEDFDETARFDVLSPEDLAPVLELRQVLDAADG